MHFLVMSMIFAATTFDFFIDNGLLPSVAKYVVELIGAFVLLVVVAVGAQKRFRDVRSAYWLVFGAILLDVVCGVLANQVAVGPIFSGLRMYLRAIPLFFLPSIADFNDRQIKAQLWLVLGIALVQVPIAVYQRMATLARAGITGDATYGTLMISAFLSIFLICVVAVLLGMYLRRLVSAKTALLLFLLLLIPTTINETKGTLLLLPVAVAGVLLMGATPGMRMKNAFLALVLLGLFGAVFIPIYDSLIVVRPYPTKIGEFFTEPGRLQAYLSKRNAEIGTTEAVGRMDSMIVPLKVLSRDPAQFVFGLGIGNASKSSLGPQFTGRYNYMMEPFLLSIFSVVVSELGVLGLSLLLGLYWLILSDCRVVAASSNRLRSGIALGWGGVILVMYISIPYKNLIPSAPLTFLFWYLSGFVAAERMRMVSTTLVGVGRARGTDVVV